MSLPQPVDDSTQPPFRSICHLSTIRSYPLVRLVGRMLQRHFTGSGFLVTRRHLLTAAHNVHSTWASRLEGVEVSVGKNGGTAVWSPRGAYRPDLVRIPDGFRYKAFPLDYAVVELAAESPEAPAFRLPEPGESTVARGDRIRLGGYPGEQFDAQTLMYGEGSVLSEPDELFDYDIDTQTGNSGGPVWIERDGQYIAVGIHVGEGRARHLSAQALANIRAWIGA